MHEQGGPDVLKVVDLPSPEPGPGEVRIRNEAIGLNFLETYQRSGLYAIPLPTGLGSEAAGVVDALGEGVTRLKIGDRVGYASTQIGAYAEQHVIPEWNASLLPASIDARTAAAAMLKGMTAQFLLHRTWPVQRGDTILVYAAAGGVGSILVQWAAHLGADVIAAVGSAAKGDTALKLGAKHVILYREQDVPAEVKRITGGEGVRVAYDSVGAATFENTLASIGRLGMFVSYGNASGPPPAITPLRLRQQGSIFLTRPDLYDYIATPAERDATAQSLFDVIGSGAVKIAIGETFPLDRVADAHRRMSSGETTGSSLLIP
ncbi:MAG: quinone oxidoreductase [Phenylobacterium sp.]|nr:quinone oxidoreductase [Phenylobacterium sp.]MDP3174156.1 quinone oxidoreductase [Phenylobacterium sp.]